MNKPAVLFLCTHNSARSQMAEALLRKHAGDRFNAFSAGTDPTSVHPLTVKVLQEIGIEVAGQHSKGVEQVMGRVPVRYAIIVCDQASKQCPRIFPSLLRTLHWPFDDPSQARGTEVERLSEFRGVRVEIDIKLQRWLADESV